MFGEELLINWLKGRGPLGYAAIILIILILLYPTAVHWYATYLVDKDTIKAFDDHGSMSEEALNKTHFVDDEVPKGSGKNLTLEHAPNPPISLQLFRNGQRLKIGPENDYTLSSNSITLMFDGTWDQFSATYRY